MKISQKFKSDLLISMKAVWVIISAVMITVLLLSAFYPETLIKTAPVCFSKLAFNTDCFMCGMTRAFNMISDGNFISAKDLNVLSIPLYLAFLLNTVVFLIYTFHKIKSMDFHFKNLLNSLK